MIGIVNESKVEAIFAIHMGAPPPPQRECKIAYIRLLDKERHKIEIFLLLTRREVNPGRIQGSQELLLRKFLN